MSRVLAMLVLCSGLALAQEGKDDEGISIDETPSGPETPDKKPERKTAYPAREPGKKVQTVPVKAKACSFALPADWVLQEYADENAEIAWDVLLPGSTTRASLSVTRNEGGDPRSRPYYQAEWFRKEKPDYKVEIRMKPSPRIVVQRSGDETDRHDGYFYVAVRNNIFVLQLSCAAADFPQAEADLLAAIRSFTANVPIWPPIPKGYETSQEGIWLIARAPSVKGSISTVLKTLKEQEKRFRREHGALPKSDAPIVVLVHATRAEGGRLDKRIAEADRDFVADGWHRRLFAIPFAKENADQESLLAGEAQRILFAAKYGDVRPDWILAGEGTVARVEVLTGKPLPSLHEGFASWYSTLKLHKLDELEALRSNDSEAWSKESFFYVAALLEGKYKKSYNAFLDDLEESGDALGAFQRHLGTIDQEDLRASTNQWISTKIRPEKPK